MQMAAAAAAAATKPMPKKANCWCYLWPTYDTDLPSAPPEGWTMQQFLAGIAPGTKVEIGDSRAGEIVHARLDTGGVRPIAYVALDAQWKELLFGTLKARRLPPDNKHPTNNCIQAYNLDEKNKKVIGLRFAGVNPPHNFPVDKWNIHSLK
jgi:hypothetical protein